MKAIRNKLSSVVSLLTVGAIGVGSPVAKAITLEEVVVTAQKRSQSVQDIPLAVTGLTSDGMEQLGISNSNDLSAQVPNMQVSGPYGDVQPIFSIRGISMSDFNANQASPVGVYADEAYLGATYTHGMNFLDVERLEVLRGPQGTLYGKNTTGGAVNIITRTPEINGPTSGDLKAGFGNFGRKEFSGAIESSIVEDVIAARVAFKYKKDDGYFENKLGGGDLGQTDFKAGRIALNWQPTEDFNAVLKYTVGRSDARSTPPRPEGRLAGGVDLAGYQRNGLDFHEGELDQAGATKVDMDQAVLTLNYDTENYTFVSVSSWYEADYSQQADTDGGPTNLAGSAFGSDTESISQDLRVSSDFDGAINFVSGIYYAKEKMNLHNQFTLYDTTTILSGSPDAPFFEDFGVGDHRLSTEKTSLALYGQFRFELSDALGLDFGIRYTRDENSLDYLNFSRIDTDGNPLGTWLPGNVTGLNTPFVPPSLNSGVGFFTHGAYTLESAPTFDEVEREFSGKVSLDYQFESSMAYISYSEGYRSGSFNGGTFYVPPQKLEDVYAAPEFIDAWEVGFKSDLLDGQLRINGAAFYYEYTDQQFINFVGVSGELTNAGGADILGLEFELWAQPLDSLTLQAAVGWLDTEYTELELSGLNLKGNELISAPEINFSFAVDYEIPIGDSYNLRAHFDANFQDDQWYSAFNDAAGYDQIKQDSYWIYNARMTVEFGSAEEYSVALWGKNLSDEEYDTYAINLQQGFGLDYFLGGAPRSYGIEVSYKY